MKKTLIKLFVMGIVFASCEKDSEVIVTETETQTQSVVSESSVEKLRDVYGLKDISKVIYGNETYELDGMNTEEYAKVITLLKSGKFENQVGFPVALVLTENELSDPELDALHQELVLEPTTSSALGAKVDVSVGWLVVAFDGRNANGGQIFRRSGRNVRNFVNGRRTTIISLNFPTNARNRAGSIRWGVNSRNVVLRDYRLSFYNRTNRRGLLGTQGPVQAPRNTETVFNRNLGEMSNNAIDSVDISAI